MFRVLSDMVEDRLFSFIEQAGSGAGRAVQSLSWFS
jgi:hypothetical protein